MSEKPRRRFWQVHLSTAAVLAALSLLILLSAADLFPLRSRPASPNETWINVIFIIFCEGFAVGIGGLFLESVHPRTEKGFRFHLSTLILLTLICGILVWMNATPRYVEYRGIYYNLGYGWPFLAYKMVDSWGSSPITAWTKNVLFSFVVLSVTAIVIQRMMIDPRDR